MRGDFSRCLVALSRLKYITFWCRFCAEIQAGLLVFARAFLLVAIFGLAREKPETASDVSRESMIAAPRAQKRTNDDREALECSAAL